MDIKEAIEVFKKELNCQKWVHELECDENCSLCNLNQEYTTLLNAMKIVIDYYDENRVLFGEEE